MNNMDQKTRALATLAVNGDLAAKGELLELLAGLDPRAAEGIARLPQENFMATLRTLLTMRPPETNLDAAADRARAAVEELIAAASARPVDEAVEILGQVVGILESAAAGVRGLPAGAPRP